MERRLRRLEDLQINWGEYANSGEKGGPEGGMRLFELMAELGWSMAFSNYAESYLDWRDKTFPVEPQGDAYAVSTSPLFRTNILQRAQEELEDWWDANCPNDPREDDFYDLFKGVIEEIGERMMSEAVHCTVPLEHRSYFLDPDLWVEYRLNPGNPDERPDYYSCLDIMRRPTGEGLKRALAFAREWERCPDTLRTLSVGPDRPRSKPFEWFRNRRRSAERASAAA